MVRCISLQCQLVTNMGKGEGGNTSILIGLSVSCRGNTVLDVVDSTNYLQTLTAITEGTSAFPPNIHLNKN